MSDRKQDSETRTIHPRAIAALGEEACVVMLGVARDLRSGAIPPEHYDQGSYCGTACCVAGHVALRLGVRPKDVADWASDAEIRDAALFDNDLALFSSCIHHKVSPALAARAIERYLYEGADHPWAPGQSVSSLLDSPSLGDWTNSTRRGARSTRSAVLRTGSSMRTRISPGSGT